MVIVIRLETFKSIGGQIEICWAQGLMMRIWVVLGEVICFVGSTWSPKDVILALMDMITNPIEAHVNGLGPFLLDVVIGNASDSGIVHLNRGGGLGMSKFVESNAQGTCMFGIEKQHAKFGLGSTCQDWLHDLIEHINGSVVWWWVVDYC